MTLSIVVPVYNAEKYLSTSIKSILEQDFSDWELILVNDGSTDASLDICNSFSQIDSRIRVINLSNSGPSFARNTGMYAAKGNFITFIDSDDFIRPNYLSNFSYNPNLDFEIQGLLMNYIDTLENNKEITFVETAIKPIKQVYEDSEQNLLSRGPCCKLFRREIIEKYKVEFPTEISYGEDSIFVKRYLSHCYGLGRTISTADYIYNHIPNSGSLTSKRHSGKLIYQATAMDYDLFCSLESNWGEINKVVKDAFLYKRALEFYNSICLCLTEYNQTFSASMKFLQQAKDGMFGNIMNVPQLPPTYKFIRIMLFFPSIVTLFLLRIIFSIKKPKV